MLPIEGVRIMPHCFRAAEYQKQCLKIIRFHFPKQQSFRFQNHSLPPFSLPGNTPCLPYDAARYEEADAVLLSYSSSPMPALPEGKNASSVNIPAALCGAFGAYSFSGILPVNIPKMGGDYTFTEETLYERGTIQSTTPASVPRAS